MRPLLLLVLPTLWVMPAFASNPVRKPMRDREVIQGSWRLVSLRQEGMEVPKTELAQVYFTITEGTISFGKVGQDASGFHYTLNSKKRPKTIDTTHTLDPGKPIVQLGIYSLDGETLRLSIAGAGMARPEGFDEKTATTLILERTKKSDDRSMP